MLSKLFSAALLATSFIYTDAACNFRSRALIFPNCNDGATDNACPFTISEITPNATNDDNVTVTINWNNAMPGVDDNKYFLLDRASSDTGTYDEGYTVTYNPNTVDPASPPHLAAAGSVYRSFALEAPSSTDCSDAGCQVHYDVSLMIGAAPACSGYDDADHIYTRAVYKFRITQQWIRVNGVVDFTDWENVRTDSAFITQADETKAIVNYEAENVQVVDEFVLKSHLDIVTDTGSVSDGICLGDGESATFSDTESQGSNTVSDDNQLTECDARAMAYIVQQDPEGTSSTAGYEDTDTQATNHEDYNDDGYVAISLSQYSQINATKSDGSETTTATVPGTFSVDDDQTAKASGGDDYRWDIATANSSATGAAGADPTQAVVIDSGVAHDSAAFHTECLDGSHSFGVTSVANAGSDRVRALAALRYRLVAPTSPAEAAQTPIVYIGAWYTHSIPTETTYNVDHADYESSDGGAYTPSRRLLRSAAAKKLKAPKVASRVHLLRVHLQH